MCVIAATVLIAAQPAVAHAMALIQNHMRASITATVGPQFYDYQLGERHLISSTAQWDAGTHDQTTVNPVTESLELAGAVSGDWWDADWSHRRCFQVDNPGGLLPEHQVRLEIDTIADVTNGLIASDGGDYRAIADDGATLHDLWVEGPIDHPATVVWVQLDLPTGATTFCLYHGNPTALSVSSEAAVFTYSAPRQLYFPVSYRYDGVGNQGLIDIVSYIADNEVVVDGVTKVLDAGETTTFSGVMPNSTILSSGPIGGKARGDGMDSLVPISFAGTEFVFPTNRGEQRWSLEAPAGIADVEIYNGGALAWSGQVGGAPVSPTVDIGNNRAGYIRVTNGVPILATHTSTERYDSLVPPPFVGDDLFGVRSRYTRVGVAFGPASLNIFRSDGTSEAVGPLDGGEVVSFYDADDGFGDGTAIRITDMTDPTAAIQQADRDGLESTAYLPERLLENHYYLPSDARYLAFACPIGGTTIVVGGIALNCASAAPGHPGHAHIDGGIAAGTLIESAGGEPFFGYFEDRSNKDETNLFGMKTAAAWAEVPVAVFADAQEAMPAGATSGTWTSPPIDTTAVGTGVFGLLSAAGIEPAGTDVRLQVAAAPTAASVVNAPFLGPDDTAATFYRLGDGQLPYRHDFGDQWLQVQVSLTTTDPTVTPAVDWIELSYDLPEALGNPTPHDLAAGAAAAPTTDWLVRVWVHDPAYDNAAMHLTAASTSGLNGTTNMRIRTDHPSGQVSISNGSVAQASGPFMAFESAVPHSIIVDHEAAGGASIELVWEASLEITSVKVQHTLDLRLSP